MLSNKKTLEKRGQKWFKYIVIIVGSVLTIFLLGMVEVLLNA